MGNPGVGAGVTCGGIFFFFPALFLLSWVFGYDKKQRDAERQAKREAHWDEVRRISIGFDATARRALQTALDHLANTLPTETDQDRRVAAGHIAHHLEVALGGARYFTYQSVRTEGTDTESTFARWANDLAARYQHERGHDASPLAAHRHEGEGLVVVSVLVATSTAMPVLPDPRDPRAVALAVAGLRALSSPELFALEVTWSPSEEMDRMSSSELEQHYPELQRLDDGLAFGRVACGYCRAPYPAELGRCPACGAPGTAGRNMN
ncbi:MAG: DUF1517 domain-containing protein [Sandaracinaceae bacterium]